MSTNSAGDTSKMTATRRTITELIETYRQGFLQLDPKRLSSIWDHGYDQLIYVAMERTEPIYGWPAIERYYDALPEHLEETVAKDIDNIQVDLSGDTAIAFFQFHSVVRIKGRKELYRPCGRVTMLFRHTQTGWRVIHYHESALAAQSANLIAERAEG